MEPYDAVSPWWTPVTSMDTPTVLAGRMLDFMSTVRYFPYARACIVVGHSLFFRELCNMCVTDQFRRQHPGLARDLTTLKVQV